MGFNRYTFCLLLLSAASLYGCATSAPRSSEYPVVTTAAIDNPSKPAISERIKRDYERALSAIKAKRHRQAERILLEITQAHADLAGPYINLGIIYYRSERLKEAEQALRRAVKLNSERADAYNHLGIVLRKNGRFKEARQAYEKALQLRPNYGYAHLNLGILYDLYFPDAAKALEHYEHYQKLLASADKQVTRWIVDLKRRAQRSQKTAKR